VLVVGREVEGALHRIKGNSKDGSNRDKGNRDPGNREQGSGNRDPLSS